jgi:hypothetical protein
MSCPIVPSIEIQLNLQMIDSTKEGREDRSTRLQVRKPLGPEVVFDDLIVDSDEAVVVETALLC